MEPASERIGRMPSIPRDKHTDDPLVHIDGRRVDEARKARKLSINQLAEMVRGVTKDHHKGERETLRLIIKGKTERCRRSRRDALAEALGVRSDWLSATPGADLVWEDWAEIEDWRLEAVFLAQDDIANLCKKALERDIEKSYGRGERARDVLEKTSTLLVGRILGLIHPHTWQWEMLGWEGHPMPQCSPEEIREAGEALAKALKIVLRPWFDGDTPLNYGALRRLMRRDFHWMPVLLGDHRLVTHAPGIIATLWLARPLLFLRSSYLRSGLNRRHSP